MPDRYRKSQRLAGFDYSSPGFYFITMCVKDRVECFGKIIEGKMVLNDIGQIVENFLKQIPLHYNNVNLDEFVVMPNHIHVIIEIDVGTEQCSVPTSINSESSASPAKTTIGLLSKIIKSFKEACVKRVKTNQNFQEFVWQRSFYDHIVRNENDLFRIRFYIKNNPSNWGTDRNNNRGSP